MVLAVTFPRKRFVHWRRAVQWLADNSLIDDEAGGRFLAGHPDPDLP
jgi:hypothetical protein